MKLAINGRFLGQHLTGVQRVALQWTEEIAQGSRERSWDTVVYTVPDPLQKQKASSLNAVELKSWKPYQVFWEQTALPKASEGRFLLNFGNTAPINIKEQAVMLHDTAFMAQPEWFAPAFRLYYKTIVPQILKNSRFVMTVSEFSKKEIIKYFDIAQDKIVVLPSWVAPIFEHMRAEPPKAKLNYILAVASLEPRKNYSALLKAYSRLEHVKINDDTAMGVNLKVAGGFSDIFAADPAFNDFFSDPRIDMLGRCDDNMLTDFYGEALFFCSFSFYEGFGLPPLEAMNAGCPLLLSDIPAHREVCGDAALYVNPYDDEDIAEKMKLMTENSSLRHELALAGKERAALFAKEKTVEKFYSCLQAFLG